MITVSKGKGSRWAFSVVVVVVGCGGRRRRDLGDEVRLGSTKFLVSVILEWSPAMLPTQEVRALVR